MRAFQWDATRAITLGLVGGYVDTVGYIMLRGLFPNHVTGNLPIAAASPGPGAIPLLLMVPMFFGAVVLAAAAAGRIGRDDRSSALPVILAAEALLLGAFMVLGVALVPDRDASTLLTQAVVGAAGVCAMGVQSVATRLGGYAFPTTMVTGTLTLLGMDVAEAKRNPAIRPRIRSFAQVVAAFAAGAALGGLMAGVVRFWALAVPVLAVGFCALGEVRFGGQKDTVKITTTVL